MDENNLQTGCAGYGRYGKKLVGNDQEEQWKNGENVGRKRGLEKLAL